ncbi:MAG: HNH endonuclease [Proteobacteria bacterium]|nr:HNH endonuclease [Pseudomonadota bacterium]
MTDTYLEAPRSVNNPDGAPSTSSVERWKPIDGFAYEVSNQGRVRSLPRRLRIAGERGRGSMAGRILKGRPNQRGHWRVTLCGDGVAKCVSVSQLVATYFVPNPEGLPFVRHKDFDRRNNDASNLEWCNHSESIARALTGGRFTARVSPRRAKRLDAQAAKTVYDMRIAGMTFKDIALAFDVGLEAVKGVCYGETWSDPSRPSLAGDRHL